MSSEIFYNKAFIRVNDKFIPLANHGSSNTFDFNERGREVAEKSWHVLNYPRYGEWLFTADEIRDLANSYESMNMGNRGGMRKTRNKPFEAGEFRRWYLAGMKTARTVEEYTSYGNCLLVVNSETRKRITVHTTEEILAEVKRNAGNKRVDLTFLDERNLKLPKRHTIRQPTNFDVLDQYFVLTCDSGYFVKQSSKKIWLSPVLSSRVKKFKTEAEASQYIDRNESLMYKFGFGIEVFEKENQIQPYDDEEI